MHEYSLARALLPLAFEAVSKPSREANAQLWIEKVALEARCENCPREFPAERFRFDCPNCDSPSVKVIRGEEMMWEAK